jgi:hypothetical protein
MRREFNNKKEKRENMQDLINDAFKYLNSFKRHRTLQSEAKYKGNHMESQIQELKMYQTFDSLELVVRGIQKVERENNKEIFNKNALEVIKINEEIKA